MSKIEWTGKTWNPVVGCDKVSAGCKNCYAIRMAYRLMHNPKMAGKYAGTAIKTTGGSLIWTGKINTLESELIKPILNKRPTVYFVNSMSDLFHEKVPFEFVDRIMAIMKSCSRHTFQILSKRPDIMIKYFSSDRPQIIDNTVLAMMQEGLPLPSVSCFVQKDGLFMWPLPNVWLGVSVENQEAADQRIPLLLKVPAAVLFLSCEPLLGPVSLQSYMLQTKNGTYPFRYLAEKNRTKWIHNIDWVIAGGESGPGARPSNPQWFRDLRDQCKVAFVPFFFKQWGDWVSVSEVEGEGDHFSFPDGRTVRKTGKKKAGRLLDGQLHNEFPK